MRKVELRMNENKKYKVIKAITEQFLTKYGIPYMIKTDRHTVFEYKKNKFPPAMLNVNGCQNLRPH